MKQRIKLKESEIREADRKVIREYKYLLAEKASTLRWNDLEPLLKGFGASLRPTTDGYMINLPNGRQVLAHPTHGTGKGKEAVDDGTFDNIKRELNYTNWLDDPDNRDKFPYEKFGFKRPPKIVDTTQQDIEAANEKYADAEVGRVFYHMNNPLCFLKVGNKYNLCRSENDRRPIHQNEWYDNIDYNHKTPCLVKYNYENWNEYFYPINSDGSLDRDNVIIESRINNRKKRLWE